MLLLAGLAHPCTWYIYDDYADGSADGRAQGGSFVSGGWRPDGGAIVYDLPEAVVSGTITFRLSNVDDAGAAQHDFLELFSGYDGSFSDGNRDNFLQIKFAGDIYDGYDGRVKLQAGPEWYGDVEVGAWTDEFDWDPAQSYDFTVSWGGTVASLGVSNGLSTSIDYGYYGELGFTTLRIPNDGSYTRDALLDDVIIAGVSLCGDPASGGGDGGGDTGTGDSGGGDSGGDSGPTEDSGAGEDSGGGGADSGTGGGAEAPVVTEFSVDPDTVVAGERWVASWTVSGVVDEARMCVAAAESSFNSCAELPEASGVKPFGTEGFAPGMYWGWVEAEGPGGSAVSPGRTLWITEAEPVGAGGCRSVPGGLGPAGALLGLLALRRRGPRRG